MKTLKILSKQDIKEIRKICPHYESDCVDCDICPLCNPNLHCNYDCAESYSDYDLQVYKNRRDKEISKGSHDTLIKYQKYRKDYYARNKQKIKDRTKKYYLKNREKIRAKAKEQYLENRDKMREYQREYYLKKKKEKENGK